MQDFYIEIYCFFVGDPVWQDRIKWLVVKNSKGRKARVVYLSNDSLETLMQYLSLRPSSRAKGGFLVEKGTFKGKAFAVRGIQKRMEYYARKVAASFVKEFAVDYDSGGWISSSVLSGVTYMYRKRGDRSPPPYQPPKAVSKMSP